MICGGREGDLPRLLGWNQRDLDRLLPARNQIEAALELGQRQLMSTDLVEGKGAGFDHPYGCRPAVRAEVRAEDIEFLVVTDDRPVGRDVTAEDPTSQSGGTRRMRSPG
jgi:hypothetical protein